MGFGYFNTTSGEFTLRITFVSDVPSANRSHWEDIFRQAAQRFHRACRQKIRIRHFSMATQNAALHLSDLVMHPQLQQHGYAYLQQLGHAGRAAHVDASRTQTLPATIVHELLHYLFGVHDEYRTQWFRLEIDNTVDLNALIQEVREAGDFVPALEETTSESGFSNDTDRAKRRVIPILPPQFALHDTPQLKLRFGSEVEERVMNVVRRHYMTTSEPFTKVPQQEAESSVFGYVPATCRAACVMDDASYDGASGPLLCDTTTHQGCNASGTCNAQETVHAVSCWETVADSLRQLHHFDLHTAQEIPYEDPSFEWLLPQRRISLVLDSTASITKQHMDAAGESRIQMAREAAALWLGSYAPGELLSLTWCHDNYQTTRPMSELTEGAAVDAASWLQVEPKEEGDPKAALLEGLRQIQAPPRQAAAQAVVWVSGGRSWPTAEADMQELIPGFVSTQTQLYTIGFGAADSVDMAWLDMLARQTGGKSYSSGQHNLMETSVLSSWELRHGVVLDWEGALGALRKGTGITPLPEKRPVLKQVIRQDRLFDYALMPSGKPKRKEALALSAWIEEGSSMARFFVHRRSRKDENPVYLLDPDSQEVSLETLGALYLRTDQYEMISIRKPKPGLWKIVLLRNAADTRNLKYRVLVGAENPCLSVTGGTGSFYPEGSPVHIFAYASWNESLSALHVEASIYDQKGQLFHVALHEDAMEPFGKGYYQAYFTPPRAGRYQGYVKITNHGQAVNALAGAHPSREEVHRQEDRNYTIQSRAPIFDRLIYFYFDAGGRHQLTGRSQ